MTTSTRSTRAGVVGHPQRSATRTTRVVYSGAVVSNGGDAAIMESQIALMDDAVTGQHVVMHDNTPAVAARLFPRAEVLPPTHRVVHRPAGAAIPVRALRRANLARVRLVASAWRATRGAARVLLTRQERRQLESLAAADLVAYTGGTTLIERYSVHSKAFELEIAVRLGKPVVLLPASLGPFRSPRNQRLVRRILASAVLSFVRDERSLRHLQEIGAETSRTHVVPDVVFTLVRDAGLDRLRRTSLPPRPEVAISVRDVRLFAEGVPAEAAQDRYEEAVAALTTHLVRQRGARVVFVSTCQGVPEYWTDDSKVADRVVARLDEDVRVSVVVDHEGRDVQAMMDVLAAADLAVCTRMHAAILALGAGTMVLPISYEFKIDEVMGQLGLADVVVRVGGITGEALVDAFARLVQGLPARSAAVADALQEARSDLRRVPDMLRSAAEL